MSHEQRLSVANNAVLGIRKEMNKQFYPLYHMAPYASWMNDPTGLIFFKGLYHVFYQHHPFSADWGPMHWGHLTSEDLLHWRHHPIVLAPGDDWDRDGCFSGSAVSHDEKLYAFYTGHHWISDGEEDGQIYQVQCLAISEDGFNFEKRGIVVKPPAGFTHFRDPKVWYQDKRWWMVCGGQDSKEQGQLLLYSTDDLEDWDDSTYILLAKSEDRNVFMWECPDFFPVKDRYVLMFSPQGLNPEGYSYWNHDQTGVIMGNWKPDQVLSRLTRFKELDLGHDFYSPQSFLTPNGRRVFIGWLDMWGAPRPTAGHLWCGMLSIPRLIVFDEKTGRVFTPPIPELKNIRGAYQQVPPQVVTENVRLKLLKDCSAVEVKMVWDVENSTAEKYGLWLGSGLEIYIDDQSKRLVVNRHYPQYGLSGYRSAPLPPCPILLLHIYFDLSSVEVFLNDGEAVLSSRIYPDTKDRTLYAFAVGGEASIVGGDIWGLKPAIMQ